MSGCSLRSLGFAAAVEANKLAFWTTSAHNIACAKPKAVPCGFCTPTLLSAQSRVAWLYWAPTTSFLRRNKLRGRQQNCLTRPRWTSPSKERDGYALRVPYAPEFLSRIMPGGDQALNPAAARDLRAVGGEKYAIDPARPTDGLFGRAPH